MGQQPSTMMPEGELEILAYCRQHIPSIIFDHTNMDQSRSALGGSEATQQVDSLTATDKVTLFIFSMILIMLLACLVAILIDHFCVKSDIAKSRSAHQGRLSSAELIRIERSRVDRVITAFIALVLLPVAIPYMFMRLIAWHLGIELKSTSTVLKDLIAFLAPAIRGMLAKPEPPLDEKDHKIQRLEKEVARLSKVQLESSATKEKLHADLTAAKDKLRHKVIRIDQLEKDVAVICEVHDDLKAILEQHKKSAFLFSDRRLEIQRLEEELQRVEEKNARLREANARFCEAQIEPITKARLTEQLKADEKYEGFRLRQVESEGDKSELDEQQLSEQGSDFVEV